MRILIPIVAGIGNALLAVPMIRQLKRKLPASRISILARTSAMAEPFRRLSEVDEVLVTGRGLRGIWRNIAWPRRRHADVYLVPFPSNRWQYSFLAAVSGSKRRVLHSYPVGYWRALHFLLAARLPAQRGVHDVQQNLNLLKLLYLQPDPPEPPTFAVTETDRARADEMLRAAGLAPDIEPIIIHAGSAQTVLARAKRWPPANYAQLIHRLRDDYGDRVIIVEGPAEEGVAKGILDSRDATASRVPAPVIHLIGPLGDAAALLQRAKLYVGSDSGLAHLAAAVGTPPVTLFAPADPDRVAPFGYRELVVQAVTPCAPCAQYPWHTPYPKVLCRDPLCITTITVDAVMEKVRFAMTLDRKVPGKLAAAS